MTIKELRLAKGLTQIEVSEIIGIPLRTLKRYESKDAPIGSFKYQQIFANIAKIPAKQGQKAQLSQNICVIGAGYVGLSLSALLSIKNHVTVVDINEDKVRSINAGKCYINDETLIKLFKSKTLNLIATTIENVSYKKADAVIIATNTDFDDVTNQFDMSSVIDSIGRIRKENSNCLIVIKSTVPLGFTESLNDDDIIFSPEFLSEGTSVKDNQFPSRIIIGCNKVTNKIKAFAKCLTDISLNNKNVIYMTSKEAEAVKLFSNAYLAMRVAYFNELDTYAETNGLNTSTVIKGISLDPRIGDYYNNPSFGYGGYCLPKDTAQLENSFLHIPNNNIIRAIVESNKTRKDYIVSQIISKVKKTDTIGFYRLSMKKNSDNYRNSSSLEIANKLIELGYKVIIYEPYYLNNNRSVSFDELIAQSTIIIANRLDKRLKGLESKVYSRDKFGIN